MSEPIKTLPFSPLEKLIKEASKEKQKHYQDEWYRFFELSYPQFYARVKKPQIVDLFLWQVVCDELVVIDKIIRGFELQYKHKLKNVRVFKEPQIYIEPVDLYLQTR